MQAFIPGTGVWRAGFAGHDVQARTRLSRSDGRGELIEARPTCEAVYRAALRSHETGDRNDMLLSAGLEAASGLWLSTSRTLMDLDAPPVKSGLSRPVAVDRGERCGRRYRAIPAPILLAGLCDRTTNLPSAHALGSLKPGMELERSVQVGDHRVHLRHYWRTSRPHKRRPESGYLTC